MVNNLLENKNKNKDLYLFFKYLWVIIILPKIAQFAAMIILLAYYLFVKKYLLKIPLSIKCFLAFSLVHTLSIAVNMIVGSHSVTRCFAAVNTNFIWYIALIFFCVIYTYGDKIDLSRIARYALINIIVLLAIFAVSVLFDFTDINILGEVRDFWALDYVNNEETMRFCGLFEYSTLVGYFTNLCIPLAVFFLLKNSKKIMAVILLVICFIPITESNSRMGMVFGLMEISVCLLAVFWSLNIKKLYKQIILIALFAIAVIFVLLKFDYLYSKVVDLFLMREGSNSTRKEIYLTSINMTLDNSPLIGMGIKEMIGDYPLGSHSTYIGVFYKTGIIGSVLFVFGILFLIKEHWDIAYKRKDLFSWLFFVSTLIFMGMLVTEDLDGVDWLIVLFFGLRACYGSTEIKSEHVSDNYLRSDDEKNVKCVCGNSQGCN